jgi:hypothetical protein
VPALRIQQHTAAQERRRGGEVRARERQVVEERARGCAPSPG